MSRPCRRLVEVDDWTPTHVRRIGPALRGASTVESGRPALKVLADAGWDAGPTGCSRSWRSEGADEERDATIDRSLRLLGLGAGVLEPVTTDVNGAIDVAALSRVLASKPPGPTIVCLQAGNVNTGACE